MLFVALMSELKATIYLCLSVKTYLLEKYRQTSSDLQVTETKLIDLNYLLSLTIVSDIALVTNAPIEVTSASFERGSSSDKGVSDLGSLVEDFEATDKALNNWGFPVLWCTLLIKLFEELFIPDKCGCDF